MSSAEQGGLIKPTDVRNGKQGSLAFRNGAPPKVRCLNPGDELNGLFQKVSCQHCGSFMPRILLPTHELTVCDAVIKCKKCHTLTGDKKNGYQSNHDCVETLNATIAMLKRNKDFILSCCPEQIKNNDQLVIKQIQRHDILSQKFQNMLCLLT